MIRVTVCWHAAAEGDLAQIWMTDPNPDAIQRASFEVDELLRVDPSRKGSSIDLLAVDAVVAEKVLNRATRWSDEFRCLQCGPLELLFTASEDDRQAHVWHVRRR